MYKNNKGCVQINFLFCLLKGMPFYSYNCIFFPFYSISLIYAFGNIVLTVMPIKPIKLKTDKEGEREERGKS